MARRRRPTYSPEFRAEAVRLVRTTADSVSKIARELGVEPGTLRRWLEASRPEPVVPLTTDERTELLQLRREIRRVREERDILKKWSWATTHPRRDESGRLPGAMQPGQGRRLLVPPSPEKNGPECCAPRHPTLSPSPGSG
jgi:transposase